MFFGCQASFRRSWKHLEQSSKRRAAFPREIYRVAKFILRLKQKKKSEKRILFLSLHSPLPKKSGSHRQPPLQGARKTVHKYFTEKSWVTPATAPQRGKEGGPCTPCSPGQLTVPPSTSSYIQKSLLRRTWMPSPLMWRAEVP